MNPATQTHLEKQPWWGRLDKREQQEVLLALTYREEFGHGTSGHLGYLTVAHLVDALMDQVGSDQYPWMRIVCANGKCCYTRGRVYSEEEYWALEPTVRFEFKPQPSPDVRCTVYSVDLQKVVVLLENGTYVTVEEYEARNRAAGDAQ